MRKAVFALLAVVCLGLAGCMPPPQQLSPHEAAIERERQLQMVTRTYAGKTQQEVLMAADRIFRLADEDYAISHYPTSLTAQRKWLIYMVLAAAMGTDTWSVSAEPADSGVKVTALLNQTVGNIGAMPIATTGGQWSAAPSTTQPMQNITTRPASYQLFFARLDYLLGERTDWLTCNQAKEIFTDGLLEPFCTVANDRTPDWQPGVEVYSE
jgi:hypothetical protein